LCGERKPRRACPALGRSICPVCCGTKREVEIACPPDCEYLTVARAHPAAVERRRQQSDVTVFLSTLQDLNEDQMGLLSSVLTAVRGFRPDGFARLIDADVAEAAGAVAATLETAARGLIYEHRPGSLAARQLAAVLGDLLKRAPGAGRTAFERSAATVLRRVERTAREARRQIAESDTAYLDLLGRMLKSAESADAAADDPASTPPSLIIP
jgi:hypothetical protein